MTVCGGGSLGLQLRWRIFQQQQVRKAILGSSWLNVPGGAVTAAEIRDVLWPVTTPGLCANAPEVHHPEGVLGVRATRHSMLALMPGASCQVSIFRDKDRLPSASTCFNILKLPTYSSAKVCGTHLRGTGTRRMTTAWVRLVTGDEGTFAVRHPVRGRFQLKLAHPTLHRGACIPHTTW